MRIFRQMSQLNSFSDLIRKNTKTEDLIEEKNRPEKSQIFFEKFIDSKMSLKIPGCFASPKNSQPPLLLGLLVCFLAQVVPQLIGLASALHGLPPM